MQPLRDLPVASLKVIAFDCDGVLFDSKAANILFYNRVLEHFGLPPMRSDQQQYVHMHSAPESLRYLMGDNVDLEAAWRFCQRFDFRRLNASLRVEPGLVELLSVLKPMYRTAVATNRTVSTRDLLAHFNLDRYFDLVVTAADVPRPKPHPDQMELIFTTFAVTARETLYIGDSPVDEQVALNTGVFFVAYRNPELRAHLHVERFSELVPILAGNGIPESRYGSDGPFPAGGGEPEH